MIGKSVDARRSWVWVPEPGEFAVNDLITIGPMLRRVTRVHHNRLYLDRPTEIAVASPEVVKFAGGPELRLIGESLPALRLTEGEAVIQDCVLGQLYVGPNAKVQASGCFIGDLTTENLLRCDFSECMIAKATLRNSDVTDCIVQGDLSAYACTLKRVRRGRIAAEDCTLRHVSSEVSITGSYDARDVPNVTIDPLARGVIL